jgi:transposase
MNRLYQQDSRARHTSPQAIERSERRAWRMDAKKSRAEMLHAEGMTASAAAEYLGVSHHTVLRHLARPEVQRRVAILKKTNAPEPELPC